MPHEAAGVRVDGLRPFTTELFDERLDRALEHGHLDGQQHRRLKAGHLGVTEPNRARGRWDAVYLSLGQAVLDDLDGVERLLGRWGGEGIAFSAVGLDEVRVLQRIGGPVVVVCAVAIDPRQPPLCFPALPVLMLAARRGMQTSADIIFRRPIAADEVEALAGPGDAIYDVHADLPRG